MKFSQLNHYGKKWSAYDLIVKGSYPRLHQEGLDSYRFFNGYIQTYIERDVRTLVNIKNLNLFQTFLTLVSGRVGQIVNYTSLGNDIGISGMAVKNWISVLKASFVIFELYPFFENINKRVIKSPKIYFTDTGLVSHLLGIQTSHQAGRDPLRGGLYENFIILEILKSSFNQGIRPELFFFRDTHGNEVDLIIKKQRQLIPVEIKSSHTFTRDFLKGIHKFRALTKDKCGHGYVFYDGETEFETEDISIQNILIHKNELVNIHESQMK